MRTQSTFSESENSTAVPVCTKSYENLPASPSPTEALSSLTLGSPVQPRQLLASPGIVVHAQGWVLGRVLGVGLGGYDHNSASAVRRWIYGKQIPLAPRSTARLLPGHADREGPIARDNSVSGRSAPRANPETSCHNVPRASPETSRRSVPRASPETSCHSVPRASPETCRHSVPRASPETSSVRRASPETSCHNVPRASPETSCHSVPRASPETCRHSVPRASPETSSARRANPETSCHSVPRASHSSSGDASPSPRSARASNGHDYPPETRCVP